LGEVLHTVEDISYVVEELPGFGRNLLRFVQDLMDNTRDLPSFVQDLTDNMGKLLRFIRDIMDDMGNLVRFIRDIMDDMGNLVRLVQDIKDDIGNLLRLVQDLTDDMGNRPLPGSEPRLVTSSPTGKRVLEPSARPAFAFLAFFAVQNGYSYRKSIWRLDLVIQNALMAGYDPDDE